jgi:hypothetical protein
MKNQYNNFKTSPKDVFMHLLAFGALYVSIVSFITLLFQYINFIFPDQLNFYYKGILRQIRWSTSALIVVFPIFVLLSWLLEKDFLKNAGKRKLKFRKWLIYFTLFLSAVTITVDLIMLVYNFYSGELTVRFLLKVLTIFTVAAGVFGYYYWDLKKEFIRRPVNRKLKLITLAVSFTVLGSVISGFFIVGTPSVQRQRKFDEQRINDLQILQNRILNYWIQKGKLPISLDDLKDSISGFMPPKDPESLIPYEYNVLKPLSFELCAVFKTATRNYGQTEKIAVKAVEPTPYFNRKNSYQQNWNHAKGRVCFKRAIDPELYERKETKNNF